VPIGWSRSCRSLAPADPWLVKDRLTYSPGVDDPRLLDARIVGRVTPEALAELAGPLDALLDGDGSCAVVLDRRAMTAPTPAGRAALEEWAATTTPRPAGRCVAWADVLDERRAASTDRVGSGHDREAAPYPQRTFTDPAEARARAGAALDRVPA
jgi:hypothetical protein